MRLALKIPSYILGIILIVILAGAYIYYFTTIPESELNSWIGSMLSARENIDIRVKRVNRDIWNHLVFESITIRPREGSTAPKVDISKVALDYDITNLIRIRSKYNSLVIDSIVIEFPAVSDSGAAILPKGYKFELPLQISIDRVYVNAIDITLSGGEKLNLKDLAFSVAAEKGRLNIALNSLAGSWPDRNIDLYSVSGDLSHDKEKLSINSFQIVTSRSSIILAGKTGNDLLNNMDINFDCHPVDLADIRNLTGIKVFGDFTARGFIKGSIGEFGGDAVIDGEFFDRRFEDMNINFAYAHKVLEFGSINGKVFETLFSGNGRIDFSTRPESFSYSGRVEHLNLVNLGPDLATDFTGRVRMTGEGLGPGSFSMRIDCDLQQVRVEDYFFDEVSGPFRLNLTEVEFLDGLKARYKNTTVTATGTLEYTGNTDIRGRSDFKDLTDFEGQIFLKRLGGRGSA
jgi:hypothetical protein